LRVGQGIKDRSTGSILGEGPDLTSRIESLARIATTDQVIRLAASEIGFNRLFKKDESGLTSAVREWLASDVLQALPALDFLKSRIVDFLKPRIEVNKAKDNANETKDNQQQLIAKLRDLIAARAEGRTDILRVSFRHPDQAIAAQFLNELANALIATQIFGIFQSRPRFIPLRISASCFSSEPTHLVPCLPQRAARSKTGKAKNRQFWTSS